jgi:aminopeptidase-like protein
VDLLKELDGRNASEIGAKLHRFAAELHPSCGSITGNGIRQTVTVIQSRIPLWIFEVPLGRPSSIGECPKEWNTRDAYIKAPSGKENWDLQYSTNGIRENRIANEARLYLTIKKLCDLQFFDFEMGNHTYTNTL